MGNRLIIYDLRDNVSLLFFTQTLKNLFFSNVFFPYYNSLIFKCNISAFLWEFFDNDYSAYLSKEFHAFFEKSPLKVKFVNSLDTASPLLFSVLGNEIILQREAVYEFWKNCVLNDLDFFSELHPLYLFATHLGWELKRTSISNQKDQEKNPALSAIIQTIFSYKNPEEIDQIGKLFHSFRFFFPLSYDDDSFKKLELLLTNPDLLNFLKNRIDSDNEVDSIEKQISDQVLLYRSQDNADQDLSEKLLQLKNLFNDQSFVQKFS